MGVGINIGGGNIFFRANNNGYFGCIASCEPFQFILGHFLWVANDAALAAAQGDIHDGGLPGHPGGQGTDGVNGLLGMVTDAALRRPSGIVVLDAETVKYLGRAVVNTALRRLLVQLKIPRFYSDAQPRLV